MATSKKSLGTIKGAPGTQTKSTGKMDKKPGAAPVGPQMKKGGMKGGKKC